MKVNILLADPRAQVPAYESTGAAAVDLVAVKVTKKDNGFFGLFPMYEYDTGVVLEIPRGYYGQLVARSSISKSLRWLANGIGIIDSDYRGTVRARMRHIFGKGKYGVGDRVAQIILQKRHVFDFNVVEEISDTTRGSGGFGSTGS